MASVPEGADAPGLLTRFGEKGSIEDESEGMREQVCVMESGESEGGEIGRALLPARLSAFGGTGMASEVGASCLSVSVRESTMEGEEKGALRLADSRVTV